MLAVVSGGSYIGGTLVLNAAAMDDASRSAEPPPLADGSAEAKHVVEHGQYLFEGGPIRVMTRFLLPGLGNLAAVAGFLVWTGMMLATYAWISEEANVKPVVGAGLWPAALAAGAGLVLLVRGVYKDGGAKRILYPFGGLILIFFCGPSLFAALDRVAPLSDPGWWGEHWWVPLAALPGLLALALLWIGARLLPGDAKAKGARAVAGLAVFVPRLLGLLTLALLSTAALRLIDDATAPTATESETLLALVLYFGVLLGGVAFSWLIGRTSLHRPYRGRLASCFGVRREAGGVEPVPPTATALSELAPPEAGRDRSYPRLLICATANVVWRRPDGSRRAFAPFVLSHDRCGIPGVADASFPTERLEGGRAPGGLVGSEPLISLMSGVATTGAAVSPSMGRMTVSALRPFIALANLRLGRWLPNPLSARMRKEVSGAAPGWSLSKKHTGLGGGYDEFVPELLGLHRRDAARVYVSDGGHYDNLGLLALLAARRETIWCVDAEADKRGRARQLATVVQLARDELCVTIDLPLDGFAATDGLMGTTHAQGRIAYPDGSEGRLNVIKLGLTADSDQALIDRRQSDSHFPYHSTFLYMAFDQPRFDAYRRLGVENARRAISAYGN
jgi:hypothetical protein